MLYNTTLRWKNTLKGCVAGKKIDNPDRVLNPVGVLSTVRRVTANNNCPTGSFPPRGGIYSSDHSKWSDE